MSNYNVENHSLINNEEEKKEDYTFIENIFQKPSDFLKDAKKKICGWRICTKIPLSLCFFMIAALFLFFLLGSFFITAYLLMKSLYKEINDLYFTNFVIDPIINKKANKTQAFNIRNEILDEIYLESKLSNVQIATEFIYDNLFYNNTINNNMTLHNTNINTFKPIMLDKSKLSDGIKIYNISHVDETEKDYFIYESGISMEQNDFSIFNYNLFSSLTHYLKLFESNLNFSIFNKNYLSIKQIFLYNQDKNNMNKILLTYCNNWDKENGLIEEIFNKENIFSNIINDINIKRFNYSYDNDKNNENDNDTVYDEFKNISNDFSEYITRDDFQDKINQLNLLKFKTFNVTYNNNEYNILLGIRLDSNSMKSLLNKQNSNVTTIIPVTDLTSEDGDINSYELHLLYENQYFNYFFGYGIKNFNYDSLLKINSQFSEEINYQNSNVQNFFNILNYYIYEDDNLNVLYNEAWKGEYIIIGKLIKKIVGNISFSNIICDEEEQYNNYIMCEIKNDLVSSKSNIVFGDIPNKDENDIIFIDLNKTAFYLHKLLNDIGRCTIYYILIQNAFTDLEEKKSNIKIIYYNVTVNNLKYHNIEIQNITTYNSVKEDFIKEMDDIELIVTIIRIAFTLLFLIASLIKIIREVFNAIKRINLIISLKDMLFNKTEVKYYDDKDNEDLLNHSNDKDKQDSSKSSVSEKEELLEEDENASFSDRDNEDKKLLYDNMMESEKEKDKIREKWSKSHFYENKFFTDGNKMIIKYTYNKLKNIFDNMDNYQSEKFAEKLIFLKRRYKLNEQNEDKEDCELSSDIYQAISKISIINMDDIFYNVFYNQSYALSQSFKMFKSILDSSINKQSIPQRNNKLINFGRILKIIYYFKKEKIQKIIEIIYDKDLKYKQQQIKIIDSNDEHNKEAVKNFINLTSETAVNAFKTTKNAHRKSFIQPEK